MTSILSKTYAVRGKQAARIEQWTCSIIFVHSEATPHICSALFCAVFSLPTLVSFVSITRARQLRLVSAFLRKRGEQSMFVQPLVIPFYISIGGIFCSKEFWIVLGRFHEHASGQTQHLYRAAVTCVTLSGRSRGKKILEKFETWAGLIRLVRSSCQESWWQQRSPHRPVSRARRFPSRGLCASTVRSQIKSNR